MTIPTSNQFQFVVASKLHIDFIANFGCRSFIDAYKETLSLSDLKTYTQQTFSKLTLSTEFNDPLITFFVCSDSGSNLCGYAKLIVSPPPSSIHPDKAIELQRLYIDNVHRQQGAGKFLAQYIESYSLQKGFNCIWLRVWDGNKLAIQKYLKWGYTITGQENYKVGQEKRSVILMQKLLINNPNYPQDFLMHNR